MPKRAHRPRCVASQDDGTRCREPATIFDPQRGGMVCERHNPERWRRFTWGPGDLIRVEPAEEEAP